MGKKSKSKKGGWKKWHKWCGLIIAFFLTVTCLSGILLNHRKEISEIDIPRSVLPKSYHFTDWNNGAAKGTLFLNSDSILLYGASGIWLTDSTNHDYQSLNKGLKQGAENHLIGRVVRTPNEQLFAFSTFELYLYNTSNQEWESQTELLHLNERISDIEVKGDSLIVVSRSKLHIALPPYQHFEEIEIKAANADTKKSSIFRIIWLLHSGEMYGLAGKIVVDTLALVLIVLLVTGVLLNFFPKIIRRRKRQDKESKKLIQQLKGSVKWHNRLGWWLFPFLLFVTITGTFLRPPLLIAIVKLKANPPIGGMLDTPNAWEDCLRNIRYDDYHHEWMLYTSKGFYTLSSLTEKPKEIAHPPKVSVMGLTVFEKVDSVHWMIGSFSGAYVWNRSTGEQRDGFNGKVVVPKKGGMPTFDRAISGYLPHLRQGTTLVRYDKGTFKLYNEGRTNTIAPMPRELGKGRMGLWHLALECHVGRIYSPLIGSGNMLFVFLMGTTLTITLISGVIILRRRKKKRKQTEKEKR